MISKKHRVLFLLQLPLTFLVGILLSFAYSMRAHEQPSVDWTVAIVLAIVIDVVVTLLNRRDERRHQQS